MAAYLQMGHDSENLVSSEGLELFDGVILSPVNRRPEELTAFLEGEGNELEDVVFDPQLYCPRDQHRHLASHPYFPKNFESAELSSTGWWQKLAAEVAAYGERLGAKTVCSPAILPTRWTSEYYLRCAEIYSSLEEALAGTGIASAMTLCVHMRELGTTSDALSIASIVTSRAPRRCYLVVESDIEPRRELADADSLVALMAMIHALENAGCRTLVSYSSSDMVLAKAAGATDCSTGKFFNLRRFTRGRFQESEEGGRQIPYWFEHSLLAFLREPDIAQIRRDSDPTLIGLGPSGNVFGETILKQFATEPGKAWLALSWRQFLGWFAETERELSSGDPLVKVGAWVKQAEERWKKLEDDDVLLQESRNDGGWIRPWRQAVTRFRKYLKG